MKLSIVITSCNERDLPWTIRSIRETAGDAPEIVVVDDSSATPISFSDKVKGVKVIRNPVRLGVGPSRHIGAQAAIGDYLLLTDAHMRFPARWYEAAMQRLEGRPRTLHCASCIQLDTDHQDIQAPMGIYQGATLNVLGPDPFSPGKMQVMEVNWSTPVKEDDCEIPCVMGASYFIPRKWFLELSPLRFLRGWGSDELMLSLKAWLSGGDVRLMTDVKIGHIWRVGRDQPTFQVPQELPHFNKVFAIRTLLLDDPIASGLELSALGQSSGCHARLLPLLESMAGVIETEKSFNRCLFRRSFRWFCQKFQLLMP